MVVELVLAASVLLQFAAAILALRLIRITGNRSSFMLIATAILLMALRRAITLYRLVSGDVLQPPDLAAELVALAISAFMLVGMAWIAPLFHSIKGSEEALRESEARYRGVVYASPDAIVVVDLDGRITMANQLAVSLYSGASEDDLIGRNAFEMIAAEDQQHAMQDLQNNLKLGGLMHVEYTLVRKDGSTFPAEISVSTIRDPEGIPQSFISIIRDVTEHRQAEEKVRKSEARLAEAQRIALLGSWEVDRVRNEVVWSDEVYRIFGLTPQEFPVTHEAFMSLVHPDDRELVQRAIDEAAYEGKRYSIDHRIVLSDGSERIVHEEAKVTLDETGRAIRMVGTIHDVTERNRMEEQLRESEEKYRTLIDNMQDGVFVIQHEKMVFVNKAFARMIGWTVEEVIGTKFQQHVAPEDLEVVAERYRQRQAGEEVPSEYEFRMVQKNGVTRVFVNMSVGLITFQGAIASMGTVKDITERKRAEKALKESEIRFSTLFETAPVAIVLTDDNGNFLAANEWMERISGYSREELKALKAPSMYVHEEDRKRILAELYETGRLRDFEVELRQKNGTIYHALLNEDLIELGGKKINFATIRDITEQKRAEEAIRRSEQRYRVLFRHSPVSIWLEDFTAVAQWLDQLRANGVSDLDTYLDSHPKALLEAILLVRVIDVNDATLEMYEADTREGLLDGLSQLLSEVLPEQFRQELLAIWENKTDGIEFEASAMTLKGNPLQVIVRWRAPVIDGRMDLSRVVVATSDITERKRAEHDLKAAADTAMLYLDLMGHDVRNHLQAILMGADIMKHMELGAEAEPVFEIILDSVNNSQSMIKKMQSTRGLLTVPVSARSLSEILNECLRSLRVTYDDVEVEMDMQVREPVVRADDYLELLLMNILENAVVHNDKRIRRVWVTVNEVGRGYEVLISDNGPGLTESKKESLFDPERRFGGVGVHQAMSIVRKYHGRISVHDRMTGDPDQGAEFLIWFPKWTYSG